MAAAGKLDQFVKDPKILVMYSKPTVVYLGAVMGAFKAHAIAENTKLKQIEDSIARENGEARTGGEELWNSLIEFTKKNNEIIVGYPWSAAYNYAKSSGILKLSEDEHKKIIDEVRKKAASKNLGKFRILTTPYTPTYEEGSEEEAAIVKTYKKEFADAELRYAEMATSIPVESLSRECKKMAVIKWLSDNIIKK